MYLVRFTDSDPLLTTETEGKCDYIVDTLRRCIFVDKRLPPERQLVAICAANRTIESHPLLCRSVRLVGLTESPAE